MTSFKKNKILFILVHYSIAISFLLTAILPSPGFSAVGGPANVGGGALVSLSPAFTPVILRGIKVYPDNPLKFDFIVDGGNTGLKGEALKPESEKLIKYFLASLTVPQDDLWVNLSPYEKDRIIPNALSQTDMGKDMLAQDYLLKQITASLIYPEGDTGKKFWEKIYKKAYEQFGTTNIPIDTFNKVWIMPEKAVVYEQEDKAFVVESRLKVMLEEDYLAMEKAHSSSLIVHSKTNELSATNHELTSRIVREVILPELENEVNNGKNFAQLRQIYNALILAYWFKAKLKDSILNKVYADKNKVKGIELRDSGFGNRGSNNEIRDAIHDSRFTNEASHVDQIYNQYLNSFKQGVMNFIKVEHDQYTNKNIPRKYFAGGVSWTVSSAIQYTSTISGSAPQWISHASFDAVNFELKAVSAAVKSKSSSALAGAVEHFVDFDKFIARVKSLQGKQMGFELSYDDQGYALKLTGQMLEDVESVNDYFNFPGRDVLQNGTGMGGIGQVQGLNEKIFDGKTFADFTQGESVLLIGPGEDAFGERFLLRYYPGISEIVILDQDIHNIIQSYSALHASNDKWLKKVKYIRSSIRSLKAERSYKLIIATAVLVPEAYDHEYGRLINDIKKVSALLTPGGYLINDETHPELPSSNHRYFSGDFKYVAPGVYRNNSKWLFDWGKLKNIEELVEIKRKGIRQAMEEGVPVFASTAKFIKENYGRGVKFWVGSASGLTEDNLASLGLDKYLDGIIDGKLAGTNDIPLKSSSEFFKAVAQKMGVDPAKCVVIDDSIENIKLAKRSGFGLVIGSDSGADRRMEFAGADVVLRNMEGLTMDLIKSRLPDVQGIIFDSDGVITDTVPLYFEGTKNVLDDYFRFRALVFHEPFKEFTERENKKYLLGKSAVGGLEDLLASRGIEVRVSSPSVPRFSKEDVIYNIFGKEYFKDELGISFDSLTFEEMRLLARSPFEDVQEALAELIVQDDTLDGEQLIRLFNRGSDKIKNSVLENFVRHKNKRVIFKLKNMISVLEHRFNVLRRERYKFIFGKTNIRFSDVVSFFPTKEYEAMLKKSKRVRSLIISVKRTIEAIMDQKDHEGAVTTDGLTGSRNSEQQQAIRNAFGWIPSYSPLLKDIPKKFVPPKTDTFSWKDLQKIITFLYEKRIETGNVEEHAGTKISEYAVSVRKFSSYFDKKTKMRYFVGEYTNNDIFCMLLGYLFYRLLGFPTRETFVAKNNEGRTVVIRGLYPNTCRFVEYEESFGEKLKFSPEAEQKVRASLLIDEVIGYTDRDGTNFAVTVLPNGTRVPLFADMKFAFGNPKMVPNDGIEYDFSKYITRLEPGQNPVMPSGFTYNEFHARATYKDFAWIAHFLNQITPQHVQDMINYVDSVVPGHSFDKERLFEEIMRSLDKVREFYPEDEEKFGAVKLDGSLGISPSSSSVSPVNAVSSVMDHDKFKKALDGREFSWKADMGGIAKEIKAKMQWDPTLNRVSVMLENASDVFSPTQFKEFNVEPETSWHPVSGSLGQFVISFVPVDGKPSLFVSEIQLSRGIRRIGIGTFKETGIRSPLRAWSEHAMRQIISLAQELGIEDIYVKTAKQAKEDMPWAFTNNDGARECYYLPVRWIASRKIETVIVDIGVLFHQKLEKTVEAAHIVVKDVASSAVTEPLTMVIPETNVQSSSIPAVDFSKADALTSRSDLEYGLLQVKMLPAAAQGVYDALINIFASDEMMAPYGKELANTFAKMKNGSVELLYLTGVITEKEKKIFSDKNADTLKKLSKEEIRDFLSRLHRLVASYENKLTASQVNKMLRRLVPLEMITYLRKHYDLPQGFVFEIVIGHPDFIVWLSKASLKIRSIQDKVYGERNARRIVADQGPDKTDAWILLAEAKVKEIKKKVGGLENAWRIVISKGLDKIDGWIAGRQAEVDELLKSGSELSVAWNKVMNKPSGITSEDAISTEIREANFRSPERQKMMEKAVIILMADLPVLLEKIVDDKILKPSVSLSEALSREYFWGDDNLAERLRKHLDETLSKELGEDIELFDYEFAELIGAGPSGVNSRMPKNKGIKKIIPQFEKNSAQRDTLTYIIRELIKKLGSGEEEIKKAEDRLLLIAAGKKHVSFGAKKKIIKRLTAVPQQAKKERPPAVFKEKEIKKVKASKAKILQVVDKDKKIRVERPPKKERIKKAAKPPKITVPDIGFYRSAGDAKGDISTESFLEVFKQVFSRVVTQGNKKIGGYNGVLHILSLKWGLIAVSKKVNVDKDRLAMCTKETQEPWRRKLAMDKIGKTLRELGLPEEMVNQYSALVDAESSEAQKIFNAKNRSSSAVGEEHEPSSDLPQRFRPGMKRQQVADELIRMLEHDQEWKVAATSVKEFVWYFSNPPRKGWPEQVVVYLENTSDAKENLKVVRAARRDQKSFWKVSEAVFNDDQKADGFRVREHLLELLTSEPDEKHNEKELFGDIVNIFRKMMCDEGMGWAIKDFSETETRRVIYFVGNDSLNEREDLSSQGIALAKKEAPGKPWKAYVLNPVSSSTVGAAGSFQKENDKSRTSPKTTSSPMGAGAQWPATIDDFVKEVSQLWRLAEQPISEEDSDLNNATDEFKRIRSHLIEQGYRVVHTSINKIDHIDAFNFVPSIFNKVSQACYRFRENFEDHAKKDGVIAWALSRDGRKIFVAALDNGPGFPEKDGKPVIVVNKKGQVRHDPKTPTDGNGQGLGLVNDVTSNLLIYTKGYVKDLKKDTLTPAPMFQGIDGVMFIAEISADSYMDDQGKTQYRPIIKDKAWKSGWPFRETAKSASPLGGSLGTSAELRHKDTEESSASPLGNAAIADTFRRIWKASLKEVAQPSVPGATIFHFVGKELTPSTNSVFVAHDPDLGVVIKSHPGEFVLLELDPGKKGAIASWEHEQCTSLSVRARRGEKEVIGHYHMRPIYREDFISRAGPLYDKYLNFLSYLADPANGLTDVKIMMMTVGDRAFGLPSKKVMKAAAQEKGITFEDTNPIDLTSRVHTIATLDEVLFFHEPIGGHGQKWSINEVMGKVLPKSLPPLFGNKETGTLIPLRSSDFAKLKTADDFINLCRGREKLLWMPLRTYSPNAKKIMAELVSRLVREAVGKVGKRAGEELTFEDFMKIHHRLLSEKKSWLGGKSILAITKPYFKESQATGKTSVICMLEDLGLIPKQKSALTIKTLDELTDLLRRRVYKYAPWKILIEGNLSYGKAVVLEILTRIAVEEGFGEDLAKLNYFDHFKKPLEFLNNESTGGLYKYYFQKYPSSRDPGGKKTIVSMLEDLGWFKKEVKTFYNVKTLDELTEMLKETGTQRIKWKVLIEQNPNGLKIVADILALVPGVSIDQQTGAVTGLIDARMGLSLPCLGGDSLNGLSDYYYRLLPSGFLDAVRDIPRQVLEQEKFGVRATEIPIVDLSDFEQWKEADKLASQSTIYLSKDRNKVLKIINFFDFFFQQLFCAEFDANARSTPKEEYRNGKYIMKVFSEASKIRDEYVIALARAINDLADEYKGPIKIVRPTVVRIKGKGLALLSERIIGEHEAWLPLGLGAGRGVIGGEEKMKEFLDEAERITGDLVDRKMFEKFENFIEEKATHDLYSVDPINGYKVIMRFAAIEVLDILNELKGVSEKISLFKKPRDLTEADVRFLGKSLRTAQGEVREKIIQALKNITFFFPAAKGFKDLRGSAVAFLQEAGVDLPIAEEIDLFTVRGKFTPEDLRRLASSAVAQEPEMITFKGYTMPEDIFEKYSLEENTGWLEENNFPEDGKFLSVGSDAFDMKDGLSLAVLLHGKDTTKAVHVNPDPESWNRIFDFYDDETLSIKDANGRSLGDSLFKEGARRVQVVKTAIQDAANGTLKGEKFDLVELPRVLDDPRVNDPEGIVRATLSLVKDGGALFVTSVSNTIKLNSFREMPVLNFINEVASDMGLELGEEGMIYRVKKTSLPVKNEPIVFAHGMTEEYIQEFIKKNTKINGPVGKNIMEICNKNIDLFVQEIAKSDSRIDIIHDVVRELLMNTKPGFDEILTRAAAYYSQNINEKERYLFELVISPVEVLEEKYDQWNSLKRNEVVFAAHGSDGLISRDDVGGPRRVGFEFDKGRNLGFGGAGFLQVGELMKKTNVFLKYEKIPFKGGEGVETHLWVDLTPFLTVSSPDAISPEKKKSSSSSVTKAPGGIDFKSANKIIEAKGQEVEFAIPPELQGIDLNSIQGVPLSEVEGFVPVILDIVPVVNIFQTMGLNAEEEQRIRQALEREPANKPKEIAYHS